MEMEKADDNNFWGDKKTKKQKNAAVDDAEKKDYKEFLDDIEENPKMRQKIMLFKVISNWFC